MRAEVEAATRRVRARPRGARRNRRRGRGGARHGARRGRAGLQATVARRGRANGPPRRPVSPRGARWTRGRGAWPRWRGGQRPSRVSWWIRSTCSSCSSYGQMPSSRRATRCSRMRTSRRDVKCCAAAKLLRGASVRRDARPTDRLTGARCGATGRGGRSTPRAASVNGRRRDGRRVDRRGDGRRRLRWRPRRSSALDDAAAARVSARRVADLLGATVGDLRCAPRRSMNRRCWSRRREPLRSTAAGRRGGSGCPPRCRCGSSRRPKARGRRRVEGANTMVVFCPRPLKVCAPNWRPHFVRPVVREAIPGAERGSRALRLSLHLTGSRHLTRAARSVPSLRRSHASRRSSRWRRCG